MAFAEDNTSTIFVEFRPGMRRLIADAIESLLLLLDEIDGDPDLEEDDPAEDGGDVEPSLGATAEIHQEHAWHHSPRIFDGLGEDEPSLGSLVCIDQVSWSDGAMDDREEEHDGREPADF